VHKGGEVLGFDPKPYFRRVDPETIDRSAQFAGAAAHMALEDAGLEVNAVDPERAGVSIGSIIAAGNELLGQIETLAQSGLPALDKQTVAKLLSCRVPGAVGAELGFRAQNTRFAAACASGNYAIAHAFDYIRHGRADLMVAGAGDAYLQIAFTGFATVRAIDPDVCRPFDKDRRGMMVSEGAAVLVLESLAHAQARDARIYAEVLGYGLGCDAYHMTAPHPEGAGGIRAIREALRTADLNPSDVDYANAHGTGTIQNDKVEALIFENVFGEHIPNLPISSTKSLIGHTMGSASAIEAAACVLSVHTDRIHPTINFNETDLGDAFDFVPNAAREKRVDVALNNANGFGGNTCAVLFGKPRA
jgi:3-oxoacyl-[acyl-carrier-protein] synthase II